MIDFLLPETLLKVVCTRIEEPAHNPLNVDIGCLDQETKQAFLYYCLFDGEVILTDIGLPDLAKDDIFYNRYFWFLTFAKQYQDALGSDAGIEQQAFKLLETAPSGVDWARIEQIATAVRG